ncbi:bifunctional ADP-dependent NAD(P)H-hydrate dehydratase/NAD(P)H-hydrate epimerase [Actinotalea sp. Marseille-Q4924]|uniref:bifunctional ADP-dependent NAD(P)H-hydrate dehydratase/NAD(P)H-hydrate epimerase n=1 Tax=Actinotalea sp. Marseille-Q4924 TaxID=2866571 RepID=UPI001CE417E4|nr:bifunctional ADP-dependent NAD(P)H-hydrate dehydratase/NAD(P)H-hydrate epimerase [Actinotalea sp. Marseille-Q4924]
MIEAFTAADVRAAEQPLLAGERGYAGGLMHHAATALALHVRRLLRERVGGRGRVAGATVVGLVGAGNNGGDTLHALALLARHGVRTVAVLVDTRVHEGGLTAHRAAGGQVLRLPEAVPDAAGPAVDVGASAWLGDVLAEAAAADVVLDGLLGIGARGGLRGTGAEVVQLLAEVLGQLEGVAGGAPRSGRTVPVRPTVVAVDVPSGIDVGTGAVPGPVLPADLTVTFGATKPGLLLPPAAHLAGRVEVVDLGLGPVLEQRSAAPAVVRLDAADVARLWPVPGYSGHKYSRGVVGVVAGTATYPGAAVLTVAGAQGAGCGMVRYVGPDRVRDAVVAAHPEVVTGGDADVRVQAWVLGPGLDPAEEEQARRARAALAAAVPEHLPVVLDAGALGLLPDRLPPRVVLTPHAGELARLLGSRRVDVDREDVEAEPLRWAREAHDRTGATVLLKGAVTVVVGPHGAFAQADAPAWLATAGAGDVLAGVLGALLAGRGDLAAPDDVARLAAAAACVHGLAAHRANPGGPVTAGDVARALPGTVADLLR